MAGTDAAYGATRFEHDPASTSGPRQRRELSPYALATRCPRFLPTRLLRAVRYGHSVCCRPEMSGTAMAQSAISLRACYAMSGTERACRTVCLRVLTALSYAISYAFSSTKRACAATRTSCTTSGGMPRKYLLPRYAPTLSPYRTPRTVPVGRSAGLPPPPFYPGLYFWWPAAIFGEMLPFPAHILTCVAKTRLILVAVGTAGGGEHEENDFSDT
eukprot:2358474-Rhodomonas_salina.3